MHRPVTQTRDSLSAGFRVDLIPHALRDHAGELPLLAEPTSQGATSAWGLGSGIGSPERQRDSQFRPVRRRLNPDAPAAGRKLLPC